MLDLLQKYSLLNLLIPFLILFLAYLSLNKLIFFLLEKVGKRTPEVVNLIINKLRLPSILIGIVISLHLALEISDINQRYINVIIKISYSILIISITFFMASMVRAVLRLSLEKKNIPIVGANLTFIIIQAVIYTVGVLALLSHIGISITPIITTLGIGGLAIGLALKDTLANIFSGFYVLLEKRIEIGDFVELEENKTGYVRDIDWRTTTIETLSNDLIIIPNEKLAQSVIINRSKPTRERRISINLSTSYYTDIDRLEKLVLEEVYKFMQTDDNIVKDKEPVLRFIPGFSDNCLIFTLFLFIKDFDAGLYVESEMKKIIAKRLISEGIKIPCNA